MCKVPLAVKRAHTGQQCSPRKMTIQLAKRSPGVVALLLETTPTEPFSFITMEAQSSLRTFGFPTLFWALAFTTPAGTFFVMDRSFTVVGLWKFTTLTQTCRMC